MLLNMKEMLKVAQENKFAVPAFNIGSGQILKAVVESANEKQAPVILAIHPSELAFLEDSFVASCIEEANKSRVPMVIHLDHGATKEEVLRAIRCGFTSVMIDGSHLPYEENVRVTKEVVDIANFIVSFGNITYPHGLFRGIVLEQIYRSFKIINNESYHK